MHLPCGSCLYFRARLFFFFFFFFLFNCKNFFDVRQRYFETGSLRTSFKNTCVEDIFVFLTVINNNNRTDTIRLRLFWFCRICLVLSQLKLLNLCVHLSAVALIYKIPASLSFVRTFESEKRRLYDVQVIIVSALLLRCCCVVFLLFFNGASYFLK